MTNGFDAMSLALFTTLAPAGAVAFLVLASVRLFVKSHDSAVRVDRMIALPFSVMLLGFIASATHLGTPANALHVFSGIGRSPLSNEVLAAVAFLSLAGSYWMMAFKQHFPDVIAKPWLVLAGFSAVAFVYCTSMAYSVSTVPTWDTPFTPINQVLSALFAGPLLGMLFLEIARVPSCKVDGVLLAVACLAFSAGFVTLGMQQSGLSSLANNEFSAAAFVPEFGTTLVLHLAFGATCIAFGVASLWSKRSRNFRLTLLVAAAVFALAAVFVIRVCFYNLYMTVGF